MRVFYLRVLIKEASVVRRRLQHQRATALIAARDANFNFARAAAPKRGRNDGSPESELKSNVDGCRAGAEPRAKSLGRFGGVGSVLSRPGSFGREGSRRSSAPRDGTNGPSDSEGSRGARCREDLGHPPGDADHHRLRQQRSANAPPATQTTAASDSNAAPMHRRHRRPPRPRTATQR